MAAERKAVSSKLKLVISYNDENDNFVRKIRTDAQSRYRRRTGKRRHRRQRHRHAVRRTPSRASMKSVENEITA